ncbi:prephenate dehydrogenase/arogenate dehydrogenase family protein [bacterium]|nr:prephenate dehydrogenase/arogenate dehydrogenase family protein [bacterium]NIN93073.1 prephenate dehydrogenase/arogenate dehydrogenase family protein [bacterium]NIO18942.1 prephenate dehydrogenase/arogenate dehydrogenase family protein [bacterium]NIO74023.1 prephenate dehydrogenase/arogenate dehydrogenase family protein [bacterium]
MKKYLSPFLSKVSIIGVGLIGGSFGLALKKKRLARQVVGIGRHIHKLKEAKRLGAIDTYTTDFAGGVENSDIVMVAAPVGKIPLIIKRILPYLKDGCIITDVGSTKEKVVKKVQKIILKSSGKERKPKVSFIGGHPMAGSEKQGVKSASANIFSGTTCVLTPTDKSDGKAVKIVASLWKMVGARVLILKPEEHDYLVAYVSHLPHVLASTLASLMGKVHKQDPRASRIIAGSISDMTRIATSNPEMWADICLSNSKAIAESVNVMTKHLEKFRKSIEKKRKRELQHLFHNGRRAREKLIES